MMSEILHFFGRYAKTLGLSGITQKNTLAMVMGLLKYDVSAKTKFEASFKIKANIILKQARFLTMDVNTYSCKNRCFFCARLEIYRRLMQGKINNVLLSGLIQALTEISVTPMDLYFGADIKDKRFLFAFWIIFGGVARSGKVTFWQYDPHETITRSLKAIGYCPPVFLNKDILNFGFDIDNKEIFYKLYYLVEGKTDYLPRFSGLMRNINKSFTNFKYFYTFSKMYDRHGRCIKEKIFIEFLEDLFPASEKMHELVVKALNIGGNGLVAQKLFENFRSMGGRISLLSFETDGTLTCYIRSD